MGYLTSYNLGTYGSKKDISEIICGLPEGEFEDLRYAVDENGDCADDCKWYNHDNDIKCLSLIHPDIVFELCGEGEESGDLWKAYYQNGKMQKCKAIITYPEFDARKLE